MKEVVVESGNEQGAGKKPYVKPEVVVYGDLVQLTRTVGKSGLNDGGGKGDPGSETAP